MQLFYNPDLDQSASEFTFPEDESKHIIKVLRKKADAILHITNGKGQTFDAKIIDANPKKCKVQILSSAKKHHRMHWFHLVVAPPKSGSTKSLRLSVNAPNVRPSNLNGRKK